MPERMSMPIRTKFNRCWARSQNGKSLTASIRCLLRGVRGVAAVDRIGCQASSEDSSAPPTVGWGIGFPGLSRKWKIVQ